MDHGIIFIIGVGRSGTTLLQSILHSHSSVHFTPETHFVKRYLSKSGKSAGTDTKLIELIRKDKDLRAISSNLDAICDAALKSPSRDGRVAEIFTEILAENSSNVRYLGDKDPMNVSYLKQIKRHFPEAKIVHIIRDPRDVVLSRTRSEWGSKRGLAFHVAEYIYGMKKARKEGGSLFGKNYLEIRYEDLLQNAQRVIFGICEFLALPYDEKMIDFQKNSRELLKDGEGSWKTNVTKPLNTENTENWKSGFSQRQVAQIELAMLSTMEELNYAVNGYRYQIGDVFFQFLVGIYYLALSLRYS